MGVNRKNKPTGVDKIIDTWQLALYNGLVNKKGWSNYESYPRVYKDIDNDGNVNPLDFITNNDYNPVSTDDRFTVTSFFLVSDDSDEINGLTESVISVIFQIDLNKLYTSTPHRFDEELINDVKAINRNLDGRFKDEKVSRGIEKVYSEFDTDKIKEGLRDRHPYNVVRFDMAVRYQYNCGDVYATTGAVCDIAVDVSTTPPDTFGGNNGTATANVTGTVNGTLTYLWDAAAGNQTTETATGLSAGTYSVVVTDSLPDSCTATDSGTVEGGVVNNYLKVNRNTNRVNIGAPSARNLPDSLTLSAWIYLKEITTGAEGQIFFLGASGNLQYNLELNRQSGKLSMLANSGVVALYGSTVLSINTWYHIAGTRSGSIGNWTYKLYLNGVLDGSVTGLSANPDIGGVDGYIGNTSAGSKDHFGGIKNSIIYNEERTDVEILAMYNLGANGDYDTLGYNGNVGYFDMNEIGTTTTVTDNSLTNTDGMLIDFESEPWRAYPTIDP